MSAVAVVVESEAQFAAGVSENGDSPDADGASPDADGASPSAEAEPEDGSPNGSD